MNIRLRISTQSEHAEGREPEAIQHPYDSSHLPAAEQGKPYTLVCP